MRSEILEKITKERAEAIAKYEKDLERNPLVQYSTRQLKEELRRRKRDNYGNRRAEW